MKIYWKKINNKVYEIVLDETTIAILELSTFEESYTENRGWFLNSRYFEIDQKLIETEKVMEEKGLKIEWLLNISRKCIIKRCKESVKYFAERHPIEARLWEIKLSEIEHLEFKVH